MLRISTETKRGKRILSVEGRLAGPWVSALEQCWREVRAASSAEKVSVDLCGVSFIDAAGKVLLKEIHRQGGRLVAEGCLNQAIVREIVGSEGEEHRSRRPSPAGQSRRERCGAAHQYRNGFRQKDSRTRVSAARGSISGFYGGAVVRRADFRPHALAAVPSCAQNHGGQPSEQL